MADEDICNLTIVEIAEKIKNKDVSPVEITSTFLNRIDKVDKQTNSYITITKDQALASAKKAEKEINEGSYRGVLHGIPLAHKDLIATAGIRTTSGSRFLANYTPDVDATVIQRLKDAGAILLGKLNLNEMAMGATGINLHYGATRNPWNLERCAGGSSGGSGAAVAAALCMGSLGTDTAGSGRIPASLCGVVALKPTYGLISRFGVTPAAWSLDHVSPLAKTVQDCAMILRAVAGYDIEDPAAAFDHIPDYGKYFTGELHNVRIGIPRKYFFEGLEDQVEESIEKSIEKLAELGGKIKEVSLPYHKYASAIVYVIMCCESASYHEEYEKYASDYAPDVRARLDIGKLTPATYYLKAQRLRVLMKRELEEAFKEVDILITPTTAITAPKIIEADDPVKAIEIRHKLVKNTSAFNLSGFPALSLRCGFTTSGLPVGMQIIGRPFEEGKVFQIAHAYEIHTPELQKRLPTLV